VVSDIVSLIKLLASSLFPDELQRLTKELAKMEEDHAKHAQAVKDAIAAGDTAALNELLCLQKDS
jgi:hypothetical protein